MRHQEQCSVLGLLRKRQELLAQCMRRLQLGTCEIITPETPQRWEKLRGVFQALTEVSSGGVRLSHFKSCVAVRGNQRCPERNMHLHFLLRALRGLGERFEQRQPLTEMGKRFDMG